jgi:signal transduction histidine kinase
LSRRPSLALRLSLFLLAGQIVCFIGTLTANHIVELIGDPEKTAPAWNVLAEIRARTLVIASIVKTADGSVVIEPTPGLLALAQKHPTLQYAVFDPTTSAPLPGSSPDLAKALIGHSDILTQEMELFRIRGFLRGELSGAYHTAITPAGSFLVATHGYVFEWKDLFYHLYRDAVELLEHHAATIAIAAAIGWLTLRQGLAPLDGVVRQARKIDMESLDQRIRHGDIPREIEPLVETINEALERLDAGVARQRRFVANAAHELRTPLTIMQARIESPEKPSFKQDLARDVRRLRNIVEQLLVYARFGKGEGAALRDELDLVELTQALVDDHALIAVRNGRSVEFQCESEREIIRGDRRALESVVGNLIDNALRAEPQGGTVIVRVGPGAVIEVVDHGEGVEDDDRERIFEPFWRKSETTPGAGLGLAIAREIVEAHGGRIVVAPTPGGGATFRLALALRREQSARGLVGSRRSG